MEYIKNEDLKLIISCAGEEVNNTDFGKLKNIYSKLKHICELLEKKGFKYEIRQDPRKQAGPGRFVFQDYQWAKVYPSEFYNISSDKFAYIIGFSDTVHFHLMGIKDFQYKKASTEASQKCWTEVDFENKNYDFVVDEFLKFDKKFKNLFIETGFKLGVSDFKKYFKKINIEKKINLLDYKKQIILQGPPGTGKTREAKLIANEIIGKSIDDKHILSTFKIGQKIKTPSGNKYYEIVEINSDSKKIKLKRESETEDYTSFKEIIDAYNNKLWNISLEQNNPRRAASLAKYVYDNLLENTEQFKLIQFHPSYTYEDFVRGIVAESKGDKIEYKNVNKTLGEFAELALKNYNDSKKNVNELSTEKWIDDEFTQFVDEISQTLEKEKIVLSDNVDLVDLMDDAFLYIGENWKGYEHRMSFKDIKRAYLDNNLTRQDIVKNMNLSGSARQHATYYIVVLKKFREFLSGKKAPINQTKINEQKYILVIDEINRANLSSVLGELIYALEYRGKAVESMYSVENSILNNKNQLILPDNLYIIGTMNTADRSVGHIDYAIRRRFAFVEVLPEKLNDEKIIFHEDWFKKVSELFITNYDEYFADEERKVILQPSKTLSSEFRPEDVWIGHSYFIQKKLEDNKLEPEEFRMKIDYEIKPILMEYVKDGVLVGKIDEQKIEDYIKNL